MVPRFAPPHTHTQKQQQQKQTKTKTKNKNKKRIPGGQVVSWIDFMAVVSTFGLICKMKCKCRCYAKCVHSHIMQESGIIQAENIRQYSYHVIRWENSYHRRGWSIIFSWNIDQKVRMNVGNVTLYTHTQTNKIRIATDYTSLNSVLMHIFSPVLFYTNRLQPFTVQLNSNI